MTLPAGTLFTHRGGDNKVLRLRESVDVFLFDEEQVGSDENSESISLFLWDYIKDNHDRYTRPIVTCQQDLFFLTRMDGDLTDEEAATDVTDIYLCAKESLRTLKYEDQYYEVGNQYVRRVSPCTSDNVIQVTK